MVRSPRRQLQRKILLNSFNRRDFHIAKTQWLGVDFLYDSTGTSICECGQEHIKRLWIIHNVRNSRRMRWIGSCCIKHFGIKTITSESRKKVMPQNNYKLEYFWARKEEKVNQDTIAFT